VRSRLQLAARKGWLRANVLYIGGRPAAFWIAMLYRGSFVSEYMGYDPEFRQWSAGMVLVMRVIEQLCNGSCGDKVQNLDFGLGHAEYKGALCTTNWMEAPVYIFSPTWKGLGLKVMRSVSRLADAGGRSILTSTKFLPKLKKVWRNRLRKGAKAQSPTEKPRPAAVAPSR
jgi:CelD/BcsL family acetyltransferase involved in cellulose biosynthesis